MNRLIAVFFSLAVTLCLILGLTPVSFAQSRAFQASVTPDIAIHDSDVMIRGLSLSIWGENPQKGAALGFVNGSSGDSAGFSWGLLNYAENYKGVHWAGVNYTTGNFLGWQSGFINYTDQRLKGIQTGWVNYAREFKGVQLGLVNFAETANVGIQVGIANVITENRWFKDFPDSVAPGMVLLNWRF
ncbi:MAG: LA_2272 family surface repeat-containing protein [Desulfosalsimonas sp.]